MSRAVAYLDAAAGIFRRDLAVFVSYRFRVLSQLLQTLTSLVLFYYVSRLVHFAGQGPDQYFAFVVVGLVILQILTSTMVSVPLMLRQELVAGTFERLLVSPFGAVSGVLAMMVFPFLSALLFSTITIACGALIFGMPIAWSTAPLAIPAALLGCVAFTPFVLLVTAAVLAVKQAGVGASFLTTLMSFVSGVFFPIALLPGWIAWAANAQPFTPALQLLRHLLVGAPLPESASLLVLKLVGFAVVVLPISLIALRLGVSYGRRRGTIIEY